MLRFSAHLPTVTRSPVWWTTVEHLYQDSLVTWLSCQGLLRDFDGIYYTVEDRAVTVLSLWNPVPELSIQFE